MTLKLDSAYQVRLRRVDVATALIGLEERGRRVISISQIIRDVFEAGVYQMVQQGSREVTDVDEAISLLSCFKASGNPSGKARQSLALNVLAQVESEPVQEFKEVEKTSQLEKDFEAKEAKKQVDYDKVFEQLSGMIEEGDEEDLNNGKD